MSSSIFFRFKSQKDPSQINFDGTSLSVFEVKREIMSIARLGDGKDFDLDIFSSDTNERESSPSSGCSLNLAVLKNALRPAILISKAWTIANRRSLRP